MQSNFVDDRYGDILSLSRIDKLVVEMDFGIESHIYHMIPRNPNGRVVLFHQGHRGDFHESKQNIVGLLNQGFSVVGMCMPLFGLNNQPVEALDRLGYLKLTNHDQLKFLSVEEGHSIKYLIEPVVIALNYLDQAYDYEQVVMMGISGGGGRQRSWLPLTQGFSIAIPSRGHTPSISDQIPSVTGVIGNRPFRSYTVKHVIIWNCMCWDRMGRTGNSCR